MVLEDLHYRVCEEICNGCGTDFDKPGSCEECLSDQDMDAFRERRYEEAKDREVEIKRLQEQSRVIDDKIEYLKNI
jgi:predicted amidophosphoribosyltransferase